MGEAGWGSEGVNAESVKALGISRFYAKGSGVMFHCPRRGGAELGHQRRGTRARILNAKVLTRRGLFTAGMSGRESDVGVE